MTTQTIGELEVHGEGSQSWVSVAGETLRTLGPRAEAVAAFVRHGDDGRYRPLSGARTLPTGWRVFTTPEFPVEAVLEAVYPLATIHQRQFARGKLAVVSLDDVLSRQSGRYESTSSLSAANRSLATATLCGDCVRVPTWDGAAGKPDEIPCPEPCSVMVALCREAALWQAERPAPAAPDSSIPYAAFDEPGNELRERYLSAMINAQ